MSAALRRAGIKPCSLLLFPGWDGSALKARIGFGIPEEPQLAPPATALERRYALRAVKQRLHQASFRKAVITAYGGRCAISSLPEPLLLDAAHIAVRPKWPAGTGARAATDPLCPCIEHAADGTYDAVIAGAAAQIPGELEPNAILVGVRQAQHDVTEAVGLSASSAVHSSSLIDKNIYIYQLIRKLAPIQSTNPSTFRAGRAASCSSAAPAALPACVASRGLSRTDLR